MATTEDEKCWERKAAAYVDESGIGIPLVEFDPDKDDMTPVYEALDIQNVFAKKRI